MLPELAVLFEVARQTPVLGTGGESPSWECERSCGEELDGYLRALLAQFDGTGDVILVPPITGTGTAFETTGDPPSISVASATSAEALARIQTAFGFPVSELAAVLRVERPTIYAWMSEAVHPQERNLRRLEAIEDLASYWTRLSEAPIGNRAKRTLGNAPSLLDLLREGEIQIPEVRSRLQAIAREQVRPAANSVRSRLGRNRTTRSPRNGDPDLLT
jgi:hypothetical protein